MAVVAACPATTVTARATHFAIPRARRAAFVHRMLTKVPHLCRLVRTRQTRTAACGDLRHEWFAQGLVRAPHLTTMRGFALIGGLVIAKMLLTAALPWRRNVSTRDSNVQSTSYTMWASQQRRCATVSSERST